MQFAILGAGPAGLSCAIALGQRGHEATIFERHPTLAPVGAGILIQPSGLRALEHLGAIEQFNACSVPVRRLIGRNHRGWALVDVPYGDDLARGVSRPALNTVLHDRAASVGAKLRLGTEVQQLVEHPAHVEVVTAGAEKLSFDAVVIASGAGSQMAAQCGLAAPSSSYSWGALNAMFEVDEWESFDELQQRFHGPRKMLGLLPTGERNGKKLLSFFWSLPVTKLQDWQQRELEGWKQELLALWPQSSPVVEQVREHAQFSFAVYRHAWPKRLARGRVCLVGDAAHAMSPQLGLGTTLAMGDALALAQGLEGRSLVDGLARYEQMRLAHVKRFQLLSRALTPCFQADLPAWWRDIAFAGSLKVPGSRWLMRQGLKG